MKVLLRRLAAASAVALGVSSMTGAAAMAAAFGQREVDQSKFIAVAAPRGAEGTGLLIIEQISNARPCWSETPGTPTLVDPLLVNFDFTGICGRYLDSNGYSIRANNTDLGLRYNLRIVEKDGTRYLMGIPEDRNLPQLMIGTTNGIAARPDGSPAFTQINLNPGWRFTRRVFQDRALGHIYLTFEGQLPPGVIPPPTFQDIAGDIYAQEIQKAVEIGFISGFAEDNTFRPTQPLTREQLVSMVLDALKRLPGVNLQLPTQTTASPYRDVEANRWSAAKIQFARDNRIVSGYEDGTFRPTQPVTRAELIAVLRRAAEYGRTLLGKPPQLVPTQPPLTFSDTATHWSNTLVTEMSAYCRVASPLNEQGTEFAPNTPAQRNYAAAATLRMFNCVQSDAQAPVAPQPPTAPQPLVAPQAPVVPERPVVPQIR